MRPGTQAWIRANPRTAKALRAVFRGKASGEQRELVGVYLARTIAAGLAGSQGSRRLLAQIKGRRGQRGDARVIERDIPLVGGPGREPPTTRVVPDRLFEMGERCWFPHCTRGAHHRGAHDGVVETGEQLVRIRKLAVLLLPIPPGTPEREQALSRLMAAIALG